MTLKYYNLKSYNSFNKNKYLPDNNRLDLNFKY